MQKKHMFLRVFSKITIFACVFCVFSACADTTTCDIDFTPVMGNSWQNGTPTPTSPVEVISVGDKTKNLFDYTKHTYQEGRVLYNNGTIAIAHGGSWQCFEDYWDIRNLQGKYISVNGNTSGTGTGGWCFYDENKQYIIGYNGTFQNILVPNNAVYARGSWLISQASAQNIQVELGSQSTSYVPYGYQIPVVGTGANGSQTTTSVYLGEPLRKVGDYADVLDYKNGTITRNVGVKVLDGTERGLVIAGEGNRVSYTDLVTDATLSIGDKSAVCSHYNNNGWDTAVTLAHGKFNMGGTDYPIRHYLRFSLVDTGITTIEQWNTYLAQQYANGTPVTVYYPLATPVVEQIENWSCTPPITDIKIATTKMVDEEFAAAEAKLATTVQTIEDVVSRTIAQTGQIATLHETKQTRPDETCPANMKCLLVQDEDGTPHWYPIIEP